MLSRCDPSGCGYSAGDTTQQFDGVIGASYEWLIGGGVATENVSLSEMKALYR